MVVKQCLSILVGNEKIRGIGPYQTNNPRKATAVTSKTEYTPRYMPILWVAFSALASAHHFNQTA
jgi:hypothetical protein